jgi:hypothetical protein
VKVYLVLAVRTVPYWGVETWPVAVFANKDKADAYAAEYLEKKQLTYLRMHVKELDFFA